MRKSVELSESQIQYIKENRINRSMKQMAEDLNVPFCRIRKYMIDNNLELDSDQLRNIRIKNLKTSINVKSNNRWYYDAYAAN